jgi:hypothetical protein
MGKALIAVGSFLVLCMAVLASAVYFTRDEDRFAVDNLLAEAISREVVIADQEGDPVDLRRVTSFDWDEVLIADIDTPREEISRQLNFAFKGDLEYTAESSELFIFTYQGQFVKFADYRGRRPFTGLARPTERFRAEDAVFVVRDGVVRPARAAA